MINRERLVSEFLTLVRIDAPSGKERVMADALKQRLSELGLVVAEDQAGARLGTEAGNLLAKLPARGNAGPGLLFSAHMDRVSPGTGIKPLVRDGLICTDGSTILAADDMVGMAALLEALTVIQEQGLDHPEIEVLLTVCEEIGLRGSKALDCARLTSRLGYVLDSSGPVGGIIVQAPAQETLTAVIHGKAAHAGVAPENGIDAIRVAASAISAMRLGRLDPETTANIGTITGGRATNIVCDRVELKGEARSLVESKLVEQVGQMSQALEMAAERFGARTQLTWERSYSSYHLNEDSPAVVLATKAARRMGLPLTMRSTGGGSDGNILNEKGIPTVNLAMGFKNAHSTGEVVEIAELCRAAELVLQIATATETTSSSGSVLA